MQNRCSYCGSTSYGKGCKFAPKGVHVHPDDSTKCTFCGSSDYGKGCRLNPYGDLHVHGGIYNSMYKENVQSFLDEKIIISLLKQNYRDFECYKLGVIDEKGNRIKAQLNEKEENSYNYFTKTLIQIKKYLGSKIDLLHEVNEMQKNNSIQNLSIDRYTKLMEYQTRADVIINELYQLIGEAQQEGFNLNQINAIIKA